MEINNNNTIRHCDLIQAMAHGPLILTSRGLTAGSSSFLDCVAMMREQKGFTLIELMFVLALISMIIAFSVGIYQSQMLNFNIDKTSMQLQQWLEGARAYYVNSGAQNNDNYTWPVSTNATCTTNDLLEGNTAACQQLPNPPQVFILPNTIETSPWGVNSPYTFIGAVHPNTANGSIFEVDVTVPATVPHAQVVAQRIASRLPSATVTGTTVSAFAAIPAMGSNNNPNFIIEYISQVACTGIGLKQPPSCGEVPIPTNCPPNMVPKPYLSLGGSPSALSSTPEGAGGISVLQPYPADPKSTEQAFIKNIFLGYNVDATGKNWIPMIGISNLDYPNGDDPFVSYYGNILVIAACVSPTAQTAASAQPGSLGSENYAF